MPELAIDTASLDASVAVVEGDRVLAEHRWRVAENYSRELLAGVTEALRLAGVPVEAVTAIAVDVGPGGYSGVRTGVATAQGMAVALGIPLAGVSRLEADALPHLGAGRPVVAVHDAGGNGLAWAAYDVPSAPGAPPTVLVAPRLDPLEELANRAPCDALWCGELPDALRAALDGVPHNIAPHEANRRSAADLVRLARAHNANGDPAAVDVVYLRPPPITRSTAR